MNSILFRYAAPQAFFPVAGKLIPWFSVLAGVLAVAGLTVAFFVAPTDATQGEVYRIIFIHVPAAWMYSIATTLARLRRIILERERDAEWLRMQRAAA